MELPDIKTLKETRPSLDDELSSMESENRIRLTKYSWKDACFGVLIAHEGAEALALTGPGETMPQCSLGTECRGTKAPHALSNVSCRLLLAPCPLCDSDP